MTDTLRQALADRHSPLAAATTSDAPDLLSTPQPTAAILVDSRDNVSTPPVPDTATALATGPGQWLVVSDHDTPAALTAQLASLPGQPAVTDLSHARCRIRLRGAARHVLQSGITIDLSDTAFPPGRSTATAFRDVAVAIHAADADTFDLYMLRSYALSLWEWLVDAASGCTCPYPQGYGLRGNHPK